MAINVQSACSAGGKNPRGAQRRGKEGERIRGVRSTWDRWGPGRYAASWASMSFSMEAGLVVGL